jgi:beta-phosphoglucomutase-like phosphatase (HAD superfamily)
MAIQLQRGVIIEFDFAVLDGHSLLLDICRARLEKEGVKLDAPLMARSLGGRSFSSGLNALCSRQHKTIDVPAVIADCNAVFAAKLVESLPKVTDGFLAFVKVLLVRNLKVIIVTRMESDVVLPALTGVQGEKLSVLHDIPNGFGFSTWEGWRRAARKSDLHDRLCVAVAGSGYSVKGALNTGMSVIVKTNPLTDHQDFSGCDVSVAEYSAVLAGDVIRLLRI